MYTAVLYRTVQNLILFWVQFRYNGWNQMITMSILNWKLYLEDSRIRKKHKLFRRCKYSGATYNTDWLFFILSSLKADWDIQPDPNLKIFFFIYPLSLEGRTQGFHQWGNRQDRLFVRKDNKIQMFVSLDGERKTVALLTVVSAIYF